MSENEIKKTESVEDEVKAEVVKESKKPSMMRSYIIAAITVLVIILGALYMMEKEGRSKTNIFGSIIASQQANSVVAVINNEKVINSELTTSIQQFSQAAAAQGVDLTSAEIIEDIKSQALDVLINTKLLKQEAVKQGLTISDEETVERLETIKNEIGGEEVMAERMATLGISDEQLYKDIKDELVIQQLLDVVFEESDTSVSEEEIAKVYQNAGGAEAGLPALEEVREQVEAQVRSSKEQAAIDEYLKVLREAVDIEIK